MDSIHTNTNTMTSTTGPMTTIAEQVTMTTGQTTSTPSDTYGLPPYVTTRQGQMTGRTSPVMDQGNQVGHMSPIGQANILQNQYSLGSQVHGYQQDIHTLSNIPHQTG